MSKESKNLPATKSQFSVQDVPVLLEQVNNQIKELTGGKEKDKLTVGILPGFGKIDEIKSLSDIIKAGSMVLAKESWFKEAAKVIVPPGMKTPAFDIDGMSKTAMMKHLSIRYGEVFNADKLKKLKEIKSTLEANLSAEMKLQNDLAKIQADLLDE